MPQCVERAKDTADPCATPFPDYRDWLVDAGQRVGAQTIDLREILCSDEECHMVIGGTIAFADTNHLTGTFARTLAPWIAGEMESLILEESL